MKHTIEFNDDRILTFQNNNMVIYGNKNPNILPTNIVYQQLKTGKLIFDLELFNGFMFFDNYNNFYDTFQKTIYFNDKNIFKGNFSLFHNYYEIENTIKEVIEMRKNEPDKKKGKK